MDVGDLIKVTKEGHGAGSGEWRYDLIYLVIGSSHYDSYHNTQSAYRWIRNVKSPSFE